MMLALSRLDAIFSWAPLLQDCNSAPALIAGSLLMVTLALVSDVGGIARTAQRQNTKQRRAIPLAWAGRTAEKEGMKRRQEELNEQKERFTVGVGT